MSYLYRCSNYKCRERKALNKLHDEYVKPPTCNSCKRPLTQRDVYQEKRNINNTCLCDGAHYPHQKSSVPGCIYETEQQKIRRYADECNSMGY